ncbi:Uncharacterized protein dnm_081150 [Desulfonema magnum]|uniref:Uncharacterized protein n=2 Tax=Desulfonema magnum TaxID=45655 RepID=A0A975BUL4_9BACT|nr:Uncharacterized protein dnm_081150 [Desulfonema magnum]
MIRATRIILILTDFVDRQVRMTAIRAADGPAKSTGKEDKKRKAHFPFLILFPCTFGNITDQQNPLASEILQFFSNT